MSTLLAYALLTVVMYAHNSSEKRHGRVVTRPIAASPFSGKPVPSVTKPIGIIPKVRQEQNILNTEHWEIDVSDAMLDLDYCIQGLLERLR